MSSDTRYRHEYKYLVSYADRELLIRRLSAALRPDPHGGEYSVRTLYFDTPYDDSLGENLAGDYKRVKFRLRMYNEDDSFLRLEKKVKQGVGGKKTGEILTRSECENLLRGDTAFLAEKEGAFFAQCHARAQSGGMQPKEIIQYTRAAFLCAEGNVRITVDSGIRANKNTGLFFKKQMGGIPVTPEDFCVMEIKYDSFLPDYIPHLAGIGDREMQSFSKYASGRIIY